MLAISALFSLFGIERLRFDAKHGEVKPKRVAVIVEKDCIGCTKCIQACPVDAILGAAKQMHTVIASECTGCELCVAPCPMDCIVMEPVKVGVGKSEIAAKAFETNKADRARSRRKAQLARKAREEAEKAERARRKKAMLEKKKPAALEDRAPDDKPPSPKRSRGPGRPRWDKPACREKPS